MRRSRHNVLVLTLSLMVTQVGTSVVAVVTALTGQMLALDKSLATVPLALQFTATMLSTIPASFFMARVGRRVGFTMGQMIGMVAALLSAYAIVEGSFLLFALGGALLGVHNAFWLYYRFAAAESVDEDFRSRAVSYVLAGGVVAAVAGPELAKHTRVLFEPFLFAGCYVAIAILNVVAALLLQLIDIPRPAAGRALGVGRPLLRIMRQPAFVTAALSAMIGYGVMLLVMTATPLAMVACGFSFVDAAFVIQWHAIGMFAPSFVTGHLIRRFGVINIIATGAALDAVCMVINLAGIELVNFWAALVLLGVGWNFMFIGGTTLLTETYEPEEQFKVQAVNDFLIFATVALASFSAGAMQHWIGWAAVNAGMALPILVAFAVVVWLRLVRGRPAIQR